MSILMNASGAFCTTTEELKALNDTPETCAIVSKSCTLHSHKGNPQPHVYHDQYGGSINNSGLPNPGYKYYHQLCNTFTKPYIISVAGFTIEDNRTILQHLAKDPSPSYIEFNLSCPNIPGKAQVGYDPEALFKYLTIIRQSYPKPYGLKLPPYLDNAHIVQTANIINSFKPAFITCCNSLGNGLIIDQTTKQPALKSLGGISGIYLKPTALGNVYSFRRLLSQDTNIIACGGIKNAKDVIEYLQAGASYIQIGTQLIKEGPKCFNRINKELNISLH